MAKLIRSKRKCWYLGISQFKTRSLMAIHLAFMLKLLLLRKVSCDFSLPLLCHPRSHSVILIAVWQQPTGSKYPITISKALVSKLLKVKRACDETFRSYSKKSSIDFCLKLCALKSIHHHSIHHRVQEKIYQQICVLTVFFVS